MEAIGIHGLVPRGMAHLAATQLAQSMGPNGPDPRWAILATALDGQEAQWRLAFRLESPHFLLM